MTAANFLSQFPACALVVDEILVQGIVNQTNPKFVFNSVQGMPDNNIPE